MEKMSMLQRLMQQDLRIHTQVIIIPEEQEASKKLPDNFNISRYK